MPLDRYPVDPQDPNASFAERLRELERRISELEGARPAGNTTISQGTLRVIDADGDEVVGVGLVDEALQDYGLYVLADAGFPLFKITGDQGQIYPGVELAMLPVGSAAAVFVTAGAFGVEFSRSVDTAMADAFLIKVPWVTDAATTGEMRLRNDVGGGNSSSAVTLAANSGGVVVFSWLHGQQIGSGPIVPCVEVRRTSGAGNVYVWPPLEARMMNGARIDATPEGF